MLCWCNVLIKCMKYSVSETIIIEKFSWRPCPLPPPPHIWSCLYATVPHDYRSSPCISLIKYINSLAADVTLISIHCKSRKNRLVEITNSNWLSQTHFFFDQFYLVKTTKILVVLTIFGGLF